MYVCIYIYIYIYIHTYIDTLPTELGSEAGDGNAGRCAWKRRLGFGGGPYIIIISIRMCICMYVCVYT